MASSTPDLTREKMEQILEDNGDLLLSVIRIDNTFLALLVKERAITSQQSQDIRAVVKPSDRKQELLDIISSNLENSLSFCIILHRKLNRDDIVREKFHLNIRDLERQKREIEERRKKEAEENTRQDELEKQKHVKNREMEKEEPDKQKQGQQKEEPSTTDMDNPTIIYKKLEYEDMKQLIIDNKRAFYKRFDPTIDVLAELRKVKVITEATENKLKAAGITTSEKIDEILETVKRKGVKAFLDLCLVVCQDDIDQEHLVTEVLGLNIDNIRKQRDKPGVSIVQLETKKHQPNKH